MAIDEVQFPVKIAYGYQGGPSFVTTVIATESGSEQRIGHWGGAGRRTWTIPSGIKDGTQRDELLAFFVARQGKLRGFRFKDWDDYKVATPVNTVMLTSTTFQLYKYYTSGAITVSRKILKPVNGTVKIYNGSTLITTGYTVNHTTGVVTFAIAPGYLPKASFEFDTPARFDTDSFQNTRDGFATNQWNSIAIVELFDV